jgi:ubiquinone/menaquinone biosynthesis C-methylase UbiE
MAKDIIRYCPQGKLLDIGTGPGWLLINLYKLTPSLELTGLDISAAMVAKAKENIAATKGGAGIRVEQGSADLLSYPDNYFDMVVSTQSLHHWKNPIRSFNEIYRVLKKGGQARIYDIVTDIPPDVFKSAAKEFGRLRILMLWLHICEEPFYSQRATLDLALSSDFGDGSLKFIGVLCCLTLKKRG